MQGVLAPLHPHVTAGALGFSVSHASVITSLVFNWAVNDVVRHAARRSVAALINTFQNLLSFLPDVSIVLSSAEPTPTLVGVIIFFLTWKCFVVTVYMTADACSTGSSARCSATISRAVVRK